MTTDHNIEKWSIAQKERGRCGPRLLLRRPFHLPATMRAPQAVRVVERDAHDRMLVVVPDDMTAFTVVSNHLPLLRSKAFDVGISEACAAP